MFHPFKEIGDGILAFPVKIPFHRNVLHLMARILYAEEKNTGTQNLISHIKKGKVYVWSLDDYPDKELPE